MTINSSWREVNHSIDGFIESLLERFGELESRISELESDNEELNERISNLVELHLRRA